MCVIPTKDEYPDGIFYKVLRRYASPLFVGTDGKYKLWRDYEERYVPGNWNVSNTGSGFCLFAEETDAKIYAALVSMETNPGPVEIWKCAATKVRRGDIAENYIGYNKGLNVFLAQNFQILNKV
jgi:hypothetical protein